MGQDDVLLGFVETVNFVHEQDGGLAVHPAAVVGLGDDAAEVGDAGGDGAYRLKGGLGVGGDQAGEGGFAGTGRPPKDERRQISAAGFLDIGQGAKQHALLADYLLLADELGESAGAHPLG